MALGGSVPRAGIDSSCWVSGLRRMAADVGCILGREEAMSIDSTVWDRAAVGVAVLLAFELLFAASVAGAAGRVALVVGQPRVCAHRAATEPRQRRSGHGGGAAAPGLRGDDDAGRGPGGVERRLAGVHSAERGRGRVVGVLRGPRHRDGRGELPGPGRRAAGAGRGRALRGGGSGRRAGVDDGRVATAGESWTRAGTTRWRGRCSGRGRAGA